MMFDSASASTDSRPAAADALAVRWAALHEAAGIVAGLAGATLPADDVGGQSLPAALQRVGGWRLTLARQAMADLAAILEGGIKALLAVHASGADPHPAAQALWEEFLAAREGLMGLAGPDEPLQSS